LKKRKEIEVSVPVRIPEPYYWFGCSHVETLVAEVVRRQLVSNKLGKRTPKRVAGPSERGPSSERRLVGETIGKRVERKEVASRTCPLKMARIGGRPRVMRDHHSAVITSPKAVRWSWDRGCNDHRILRRVPIDRRHSRSSRGIGFHETVSTVVLVISASSDPYVSNSPR
jgi:hypothetical protein